MLRMSRLTDYGTVILACMAGDPNALYSASDVATRVSLSPPTVSKILKLMARAGLAAAELARQLAGDSGKPILIIAGPGNNGGDALVTALHLKQWWHPVTVVCPGGTGKYSGEAAAALRDWKAAGGTWLQDIPANQDWSLVIDGLFGIGVQRDLSGDYAALVEQINSLDAQVLALDIPSGLDADTGRVMGSAIVADHTMTFIALKPGLLTLDGTDHCGEISVADLARRGRLAYDIESLLEGAVLNNQFNAHFGYEINLVFRSSVGLGMSALAAKALYLGHSDALDAGCFESLFDIIKFERLHDGCNQLHGLSLPSR